MPVSPSNRNSAPRSVRLGIMLICSLSIALAAMLGCNDDYAEGKEETLASFVPEGTLVFAALDLENIEAMNDFYEEAVDLEAHRRYEREMLALIPEMTGLQIDLPALAAAFAAGTADWMDDEIAVVVGEGIVSGRPEVALWMRTTSAEEAEEGFPLLLDEVKSVVADILEVNPGLEGYAGLLRSFGFSFETSQFAEATLHSMEIPGSSEGFHWAATGDALVVGADVDYLHSCMNGLAEKKSHVRVEQFEDAYEDHVVPHPMMWVYVDAESARDLMRKEGEYAEIPREVRRELDAVQGLMMSVGSEEFTVTTSAKALLDPAALSGTEYMKTALTWSPDEHELDPYVQRGSAPFYMSMNHVGDITRFVVNKIAEADPYDLSDTRETAREATGHTLDAIIAAVGDEAAFAFHGLELDVMGLMMGREDAAKADLVLAIEVLDEDLVRDLLRFAGEALPEATEGNLQILKKSDRHYVMEVVKQPRQNMTILLEDSRLLMSMGREDFAETGSTAVGDPMAVDSNMKFVMDWAAMAELSRGLYDSIEKAPMIEQLVASSPESKVMYDRWKFFMTEAILVYDETVETLTIDEDAVAIVSTHTINEEGLLTIPYDKLIDVNREQLRELFKMIKRQMD